MIKDYQEYRKHPLKYFQHRLGIPPETIDWTLLPEYEKHKWEGTRNPLMSVINGISENQWVGVESATGMGKTYLGALLLMWFLECFENSIVITTAPKREQLQLHIWKEVSKLHSVFGLGELQTLRLRMKQQSDDWAAIGFVAGVKAMELGQSAKKAQGFHAEHMLIIFEETPGIAEEVIHAFEATSVAEHNIILAFGNPDHEHDALHKFCTKPNVKHVRISAFDHPNVVLDRPSFIPGAQTRKGIKTLENTFGLDSPMYVSRVKGISPGQPEDSLIRIEWCTRSKSRWESRMAEFPDDKKPDIKEAVEALGVDVANSENGDKAAIAHGIANLLWRIWDFQCPDSNQLGHQVYQRAIEHHILAKNIGVDSVGVGAGTVNTLKEHDFTVRALNGGEAAIKVVKEKELYQNLRAQMYWAARYDLQNDLIDMPPDDELIGDLTCVRWKVNGKVIIVEKKDEIKRRLGRSPNKGDAFVYWNWVRRLRTMQLRQYHFGATK